MIKVTCKKCGKHLKAPDASFGKRGQCPDCGEIFRLHRIKFLNKVSNEVIQLIFKKHKRKKKGFYESKSERYMIRENRNPDVIRLQCSGCGRDFEFRKGVSGSKGKCPDGGIIYHVPGLNSQQKPISEQKDAGELFMNCKVCNQVISVDSRECPNCSTNRVIQRTKEEIYKKFKEFTDGQSGMSRGDIDSRQVMKSNMKKCSYCADEIYQEALKCNKCGEFLVESGQEGEEDKEENIVKVTKVKTSEMAGLGCLIQALGLAMLFFIPIGTFLGIILLVYGGLKSRFLICSYCGNRIYDKWLKICPCCKTEFL